MTSYERFKKNHPRMATTGESRPDLSKSDYEINLRKMYAQEAQADALQAIDAKMQAFIDAMQVLMWQGHMHVTDEEAERERREMMVAATGLTQDELDAERRRIVAEQVSTISSEQLMAALKANITEAQGNES